MKPLVGAVAFLDFHIMTSYSNAGTANLFPT